MHECFWITLAPFQALQDAQRRQRESVEDVQAVATDKDPAAQLYEMLLESGVIRR